MPPQALRTFYPGDLTTVIMLDHDHRYLTAFDLPTAANVAHVIVADSRRNPLSLLNFNCRRCDLASDVGRAHADIFGLRDLGPPPAYEVDRELPDYHQQDQERSDTDRPRGRRRSLEQLQVAEGSPVGLPRRLRSGSPVRRRFRGREALERALRRQAEVMSRNFQLLTPEAPPAALVIAQDFQPSSPTVQPESESPAVDIPRSTPARMPRFSEVFDERHYEALARFTGEARENSGRRG